MTNDEALTEINDERRMLVRSGIRILDFFSHSCLALVILLPFWLVQTGMAPSNSSQNEFGFFRAGLARIARDAFQMIQCLALWAGGRVIQPADSSFMNCRTSMIWLVVGRDSK
jgi:hypothetical protein